MNAKELIEILKSNSIKYEIVMYRHALCWYLYKKHVPCIILTKVLHCKRRQVYRRLYTCRDLLEAKDKNMLKAYNEISNHEMSIYPNNETTGICTICTGYNLVIDNEIY